jgi:hypothetical protein
LAVENEQRFPADLFEPLLQLCWPAKFPTGFAQHGSVPKNMTATRPLQAVDKHLFPPLYRSHAIADAASWQRPSLSAPRPVRPWERSCSPLSRCKSGDRLALAPWPQPATSPRRRGNAGFDASAGGMPVGDSATSSSLSCAPPNSPKASRVLGEDCRRAEIAWRPTAPCAVAPWATEVRLAVVRVTEQQPAA